MPAPTPVTVPAPRAPATPRRLATENLAILTPAAVIVSWLVTLVPVEVPAAVQAAIAALVVALGNMLLSRQRDLVHAANGVAKLGLVTRIRLLLLVGGFFVLGGCVTYDGPAVSRIARHEIVHLHGKTADDPIDPTTCDALKLAAIALRNDEGPTQTIYAPLFAGPTIDPLASRFDRMGSICYELEGRDSDRGIAPEIRTQVRSDWIRAWTSARALAGDEEE